MFVKILFNEKKRWARKLAREIASFLKSNGISIRKGPDVDTTVMVGGDGTLLYYNFIGKINSPVLGIGGRNSVICQLKNDDWKAKILSLLRRGKCERRMMLSVSVGGKEHNAINDVVVHTTNYRVIEVDVFINNRKHSFSGDGIIVSTPTGSGSYAYSAGGQRISPTLKKILIVPICPYMHRFSPKTVGSNAVVKIKSKDKAALIVDGIFVKNITGKTVTVKKNGTLGYIKN